MSFNIRDLDILYEFSHNKNFIMETGGGESTFVLSKSAKEQNSIFVSIEVDKNISNFLKRKSNYGDFQVGWSISYKDVILKNNEKFVDLPKKKRLKYPWLDRKVVISGKKYMVGENDLIRKSVKKYNLVPDFFFCDTGEFCGLSEWNIISALQKQGDIFACHDICYPKSIKSFQILIEIEKQPDKWEVLEKTNTKQGLLVVRKIGETE